jgi:hypothetical protein
MRHGKDAFKLPLWGGPCASWRVDGLARGTLEALLRGWRAPELGVHAV